MSSYRRCAILLLPLLVVIGTSPGADETTHEQAILRLFQLTHMEQKVQEGVASLLALQMQRNPELVPYEEQIRSFMNRYIGWKAMRDDLIRMYRETFTVDELQAMNAFYITPVGQKVLTRVPELVQERNRLAARRLRDHVDELQQAVQAAAARGEAERPSP
jgi:hypothetical protein